MRFREQFLSSIFQLRADSVAPRFFPTSPLSGLACLPTRRCPFQVQLPLQGPWLQQGHQLVTPSPSPSGPWFSLSRTVVLSWLSQPFLLILCYVIYHPQIPLPHSLLFLILQQAAVSVWFFSFCLLVRFFSFSSFWKSSTAVI